MKAIIVGATGATGKDLLTLLLQDKTVEEVTIFARKNVETQHEKLKVHVIDFDQSESWKHLVQGDVLFSCLGTTLKTAGSKEAQWKVDFDYQLEFAKAAKDNDIATFVLISSAMASPDSSFFYMKMKGKLEEAVKQLQFKKTIIFRPPSLIRKNTKRNSEFIGIKMIQFFNKLGLFINQKPMSTETLAKAMLKKTKSAVNGTEILDPKQIWNLTN